MRKMIWIYALVATLAGVAACGVLRRTVAENGRLKSNERALLERLEQAHTQLDSTHHSIEVLRLRCHAYEEQHGDDAATIRSLGVRLRRVESVAKQVTETALAVQAPLQESVVVRRDTHPLYDSVRRFTWRDPWVSIEGEIARERVVVRFVSVDTLHQILHRVPRRFLFLRWGTKAVRQEIRSANPHTRLVYADYVAIER